MIFYVLAYFVIASMMAAIGAAVNEMREAQTLMTPVMLVMMLPWMLWLPISAQSELDVQHASCSFVPPINIVRHAAAHDLEHAAAGLAGVAVDRSSAWRRSTARCGSRPRSSASAC